MSTGDGARPSALAGQKKFVSIK